MHAVMYRPLDSLPALPPSPEPAAIVLADDPPEEDEIPYPLPDNEEEDRKRLDAGHYALKSYLGGNYIAPGLSDFLNAANGNAASGGRPQILDIGTGSGIWALEMAEEFPNADILGVDIAPVTLSSRHVPPNCKFDIVNLATDWPFAPNSFDVIHSRFCLVHLPNPHTIIQRMLLSLKPSGYLLLEEGTNNLFSSSPSSTSGPPEGVKRFYEIYGRIMRSRGVDGEVGPKMLGWIRESGECEMLGERVLRPPMGSFTKDKALNNLGETLKQFLIKGYGSMVPRLQEHGITSEVVRDFERGVNRDSARVRGRLNWVWARKRGEDEGEVDDVETV